MRQNILILWLLFALFKCDEDYYLSLEMLISGSTKYKLNLNSLFGFKLIQKYFIIYLNYY